MFHFPATPQPALYIQASATGHNTGQVTPFGNPGITVQLATPPGLSRPHTSFIGHPAPRHPPCALHDLTNTQSISHSRKTKTLTHTIQISNNTPTPTTSPPTSRPTTETRPRDELPQNPNRAPDPAPTSIHQQDTNRHQARRMINASSTHQTKNKQSKTRPHPDQHSRDQHHDQPAAAPQDDRPTPTRGKPRLLRKEVIQPHLPVRLPCYDFVLIASPTFDHSPPENRVRPQASGVANFHDVTGGVYKARERIHRSVADLRLLATPPSSSRVADSNPNHDRLYRDSLPLTGSPPAVPANVACVKPWT